MKLLLHIITKSIILTTIAIVAYSIYCLITK